MGLAAKLKASVCVCQFVYVCFWYEVLVLQVWTMLKQISGFVDGLTQVYRKVYACMLVFICEFDSFMFEA